ncbi:hypothetical protein GO755_27095 [Spirosoma sp. HMF4905]|uniref:Dystroglycan-type cadherin-like domain-containing protein n=1 Tax=Spirosoma arboris TaxID=2682092 RepID=A0A7K1SJ26_9BACT|nr:hypothetical protein [Spirosoma arboris]MVM33734.1 hypothetical protein [Spirosoma arboris]
MSTRTTTRTLGWLIGLLLLVCWNLQAEVKATLTKTDSSQASTSIREPNTAIDPTPLSLTAIVGVPFKKTMPLLVPLDSLLSYDLTGLPANGLRIELGRPPGIQGIPLTSGVVNLTLVNNTVLRSAWRPIIITVIDAPLPPPLSLTAIVGVPFQKTMPLLVPLDSLLSYDLTGLPANGLRIELGRPPGIQGIPITSGVVNLTLVNNTVLRSAWRPIIITVIDAPPVPPLNLTATVGVPFQQTLPYLVPVDSLLSLWVTGLPANGLNFAPSSPPAIQGIPLTSGVMNLTLVNNTVLRSAWRPIVITVNPSATSFAITGVNLISCQTISANQRLLTFNPQYVGTTGQPIIFTVYQQLPLTSQPGPYSLNLDSSNPIITLIAQQNGVLTSYNYQWLAACNNSTPNRPPTTTGIPPQTAQPGQAYQLSLANYFTDPDGNPLTYIVSGLPSTLNLTGVIISGTPSGTGSFPISVTAVDPSGLFVATSFQLTVNGTTPPTQPFALVSVTTNGCQNLGGNQWQVTFTPQYTGLTGEPIVLAMTNGTITTQAGPYSQTLSTNEPLLTLIAQQGNTTSAYNYFWLAACTGGARQGASEVSNGLQVKVFGNPIQSQQVDVEISGVMGSWVEVTVMDLQGRSHHQQRLEWPSDGERISLPVGQGAGMHLVQVRTKGQVQTVKLIKSR